MVKRLTVTLEQDEYSALLRMAMDDLRNPSDELRHLLRREIEKRFSCSKVNNKVVEEARADTMEVSK